MLQTRALTVSRKDAAKCWNAFGAVRRIMYVQNVEQQFIFKVMYDLRYGCNAHFFLYGSGISYTLYFYRHFSVCTMIFSSELKSSGTHEI